MEEVWELNVYSLEDDEIGPELEESLLRDTYSQCLFTLQHLAGSLQGKRYFELYNDETLKSLFFHKDGTPAKNLKEIEERL